MLHSQILPFYHYMFNPTTQWFTGGFYGNQTQWTIVQVPVYVLVLVSIYRKKWECTEKGCWRIGHHQVGNTHYKTCLKHTNDEVHDRLMVDHKRKHPNAHAFLHKTAYKKPKG